MTWAFYQPATILTDSSGNGQITGYENVQSGTATASLASKNLLTAGTTPVAILSEDASQNLLLGNSANPATGVYGALWAQDTQASLNSTTLLEAGTGPTAVITVDSNGFTNFKSPSGTAYFKLGSSLNLISGSIALSDGTNGKIVQYFNVSTAGGGVPAEYASTLTTAVALQTTSTAITTYTPTLSGLFLVVVNMTHVSASIAGTLTIGYTEPAGGSSAAETQSYTIAAAAAGVSVSQTFLCNAVASTAITVNGTSATNNDIIATAAIFAL